jgi:hypothetical protein
MEGRRRRHRHESCTKSHGQGAGPPRNHARTQPSEAGGPVHREGDDAEVAGEEAHGVLRVRRLHHLRVPLVVAAGRAGGLAGSQVAQPPAQSHGRRVHLLPAGSLRAWPAGHSRQPRRSSSAAGAPAPAASPEAPLLQQLPATGGARVPPTSAASGTCPCPGRWPASLPPPARAASARWCGTPPGRPPARAPAAGREGGGGSGGGGWAGAAGGMGAPSPLPPRWRGAHQRELAGPPAPRPPGPPGGGSRAAQLRRRLPGRCGRAGAVRRGCPPSGPGAPRCAATAAAAESSPAPGRVWGGPMSHRARGRARSMASSLHGTPGLAWLREGSALQARLLRGPRSPASARFQPPARCERGPAWSGARRRAALQPARQGQGQGQGQGPGAARRRARPRAAAPAPWCWRAARPAQPASGMQAGWGRARGRPGSGSRRGTPPARCRAFPAAGRGGGGFRWGRAVRTERLRGARLGSIAARPAASGGSLTGPAAAPHPPCARLTSRAAARSKRMRIGAGMRQRRSCEAAPWPAAERRPPRSRARRTRRSGSRWQAPAARCPGQPAAAAPPPCSRTARLRSGLRRCQAVGGRGVPGACRRGWAHQDSCGTGQGVGAASAAGVQAGQQRRAPRPPSKPSAPALCPTFTSGSSSR